MITELNITKLLEKIKKNYERREMTSVELEFKADMSEILAFWVLHTYKLRKFKLTWKLSLIVEIKVLRYEFAMKYKD